VADTQRWERPRTSASCTGCAGRTSQCGRHSLSPAGEAWQGRDAHARPDQFSSTACMSPTPHGRHHCERGQPVLIAGLERNAASADSVGSSLIVASSPGVDGLSHRMGRARPSGALRHDNIAVGGRPMIRPFFEHEHGIQPSDRWRLLQIVTGSTRSRGSSSEGPPAAEGGPWPLACTAVSAIYENHFGIHAPLPWPRTEAAVPR
jgi:hypothetical protein